MVGSLEIANLGRDSRPEQFLAPGLERPDARTALDQGRPEGFD